jgi:hypothetical protein
MPDCRDDLEVNGCVYLPELRRLVGKPFQDSLTRQEHEAYSIADFAYSTSAALEKLSEFDGVIALWSDGAASNDGFLAIATDAAPAGEIDIGPSAGLLGRYYARATPSAPVAAGLRYERACRPHRRVTAWLWPERSAANTVGDAHGRRIVG